MSMGKSNRQQTIQMAFFVIGLLTVAAILFAITSCSPPEKARQLPANEQAYISELDKSMHDLISTNVEIDSMVSLGHGVCTSRAQGLDTVETLTILDEQFTTTQAKSIFASAVTNLCK